jgi:hypothetical protein
MINYRVEDLDAVLATLKAEGVTIDPHREDYEAASPGSWIRRVTASSCGSRPNRSKQLNVPDSGMSVDFNNPLDLAFPGSPEPTNIAPSY